MRKYIALIVLMIVVGGGLTVYLLTQTGGLEIIITNETDEEISDLTITYDHIASDDSDVIEIDTAEQSTEEFDEGALELQYSDNNGVIHSEIIFGYFEKGASMDAEVTIKSIDNDGNLEMEIEDITGIY